MIAGGRYPMPLPARLAKSYQNHNRCPSSRKSISRLVAIALTAYTLSPMHSKRLRADLALGFTALIWGGTFVVVKDALADVSVFMYLAVRFALAAVVMAIFFWRSLRGLTRSAVWAGAQIGFFMFAALRVPNHRAEIHVAVEGGVHHWFKRSDRAALARHFRQASRECLDLGWARWLRWRVCISSRCRRKDSAA